MISKEEVVDLAELARLKLSNEEVVALQKDISNILEYVGQLGGKEDAVLTPQRDADKDGGSEKEKQHPPVRNVLREDTPRSAEHPLSGKEEAVKAAFPKREGDFNVVRKIIQKDE